MPRRKLAKKDSKSLSVAKEKVSSTSWIDEMIMSFYTKVLGVMTIVETLKAKKLSFAVCLFPHANIDVSVEETELVFRLINQGLPALVDGYLFLIRKLGSSQTEDERQKAWQAAQWASKVFVAVMLSVLAASDDILAQVMKDGALQKFMAPPVLPILYPTGSEKRNGE